MGLYDPKKLGFGCMRFTTLENGEVDLELVKKMFDIFMAKGFTYFDTAYVYLDGHSETAIRECLVKRYPRDSFTVATKLPSRPIQNGADPEALFNEQLERLGVDYIDFYLLHNANSRNAELFSEHGCWDFLAGLKERGLARRVGFSFHDTPEKLDELLTAHPFVDFVQLQINYIDWEAPNVQSRAVYEVARKHGKQVIIMEPVKGGLLATPCEEAAEVLADAVPGASPATIAVRFAAGLDGVLTVLSGMNAVEQVEDNTAAMDAFEPLTPAQMDAVWKAADIINAIPAAGCTACRYCCEGCPMQINIPGVISALNNMRRYGVNARTEGSYRQATRNGGLATDCVGCGQCEAICPQHLPVPELLKEIAEKLG